MPRFCCWIALATVLAGCSRVKGPEAEPVEPNLDDIWAKIFVRQCAASSCHSMKGNRSGLVLACSSDAKPTDDEILGACLDLVNQDVENPNVDDGEIRVIPGDAQHSFLVKVLEGNIETVSPPCREGMDQNCNCPMPFKNDCSKTMPADRILAIRQWIDGMPPSGCFPAGEPAPDVGPPDGAVDAAGDAIGDAPVDGVD